MAKLALIFGGLLIAQGVGFFFGLMAIEGDKPSFTALIPAFLGALILVSGLVALKESLRMHAMHAVAGLALLGFLMAAGRLVMTLASGNEFKVTSGGSLLLMALLCGALLALCVKSFIDARRRRQANEASGTSN